MQGKAGVEVPGESTEVDMTRGAQEELGVKSRVTGVPAARRRVLDLNEASQCAQGEASSMLRRSTEDKNKAKRQGDPREIRKGTPRKSKG